MGLRELSFVIFLIATISFPFFFSKKELKIDKFITLPYVVINNGTFKSYKDFNLSKNGNFKVLSYFNENNYTSQKVKIFFLDRNSSLYSEKLVYNGIYNFKDAKYKTDEYIYLAQKAIYDGLKNTLIGYDFEFFNEKIDGQGNYMEYKNNILTADKIHYTIKGLK